MKVVVFQQLLPQQQQKPRQWLRVKGSAKRQLSARTLPALANQSACACAFGALLLAFVLAHSQQRVINRQGMSRQTRCSQKMKKRGWLWSGGCGWLASINAATPAEREWQQLAHSWLQQEERRMLHVGHVKPLILRLKAFAPRKVFVEWSEIILNFQLLSDSVSSVHKRITSDKTNKHTHAWRRPNREERRNRISANLKL